MTFEERGAYITILCYLADKGSLSEDDVKKIVPDNVWEKVSKKFEINNGLISNKRLAEEVEKRKRFTESRRANANASAKHMHKHMHKHMENVNENRNRNKDVNEIRKGGVGGKQKYGESGFVMLTVAEFEKLVARLGEKRTHEYIQKLENYIASKGKKYKSHYHTILNWLSNEPQEPRFRGSSEIVDTAERIRKELAS